MVSKSTLFKGSLLVAAFLLIAWGISILSTSSFSTTMKTQKSFTRQSTSGSADPLSEGLYAPRIRLWKLWGAKPATAQKPLIDLSVPPMKRELPHMSWGDRWIHRGR